MIINNLDTKRSSDIYDISPKIVRLTGQTTTHCLSIILNRCIKGHFPTFLKLTKVIPLHKSDSVLSVSKYRPISLLPSLVHFLIELFIISSFSMWVKIKSWTSYNLDFKAINLLSMQEK